MQDFAGKVAVITGAASGFGRAFASTAVDLGMRVVLADIQPDPLSALAGTLRERGAEVETRVVDVSRGADVDALAEQAFSRFGQVDLLFNNAGVATGGLIWEHTETDWQWVLGVNQWGVIHGIRAFVPRMLAQGTDGHVVNTASVAGLITPQAMAAYNVGKHAVVALSESLYHDLRLVDSRLGVTVLCPAYVPTGIAESARHRPDAMKPAQAPTASQIAAQASLSKAVSAGRLSADDVAALTFEAIREQRFYLLTHPKILEAIRRRHEDIEQQRSPSDPFAARQHLRVQL